MTVFAYDEPVRSALETCVVYLSSWDSALDEEGEGRS